MYFLYNRSDARALARVGREMSKEKSKMSKTLKCNVCHIVIDELLAYMQNKISIADEVTVVQICSSAFSCEQIETANSLLLESLPTEMRKTVRKGKGKENRLLHDIINIFKITEPDVLPIFVARDLEKLPPITFDHLDVSKLLKDLMLVQAEIKAIKSSYATVQQLEDIKREYLGRKMISPAFSATKINMKRGGYSDSGPIGLSYLEENVANIDQSYCGTSSPTNYGINYSDLNKNNLEGSQTETRCNVLQQSPGRYDASTSRSLKQKTVDVNDSSSLINKTSGQHSEIIEKQTYASQVKCDNAKGGWTVVRKKSQKSRNRFIGKTGSVLVESEEKFRAAERKIPLFITNVHKDSSEIDIITYIKNKTKEDVSLEKILIKRHCQYDAYKLLVSQSKLPLYLDENLWPQGIIFRKFVHFKPKKPTETAVEVTSNKQTN